jgi:putative nucleotidyltransferase with HDIG domain
MTEDRTLERIAKAVGDLQAMPAVVEKVLRMAQDPETEVKDLRAVIEVDPGLTSKILRVANSAYYQRTREIASLSHAIRTLGFKTLVSLTVASSTKTIFDQHSEVTRQVRTSLWDHSISTAFLASMICKSVPQPRDQEICFLGGLLHDIGKLVISRSFPTQFKKIRHEIEEKAADPARAECDILGFRHEVLGAHLARQWKLPELLENVIHYHHDFSDAPAGGTEAAVVCLADRVATELGWNFPSPNLPPLSEHPAAERLEIDGMELQESLEDLREQVESVRSIF